MRTLSQGPDSGGIRRLFAGLQKQPEVKKAARLTPPKFGIKPAAGE
jgi:hypothetical protein